MELAEMLAHSLGTVPYYQGLNLGLACVLQDFPLLDRKIIANSPELFLSKSYKKDELIVHNTSGTTGMPLALYQHPADRARAAVALWGARRWHGVRSPSEPSCQFYGYHGYNFSHTSGPRLVRVNRHANVMQFNRYDLTDEACDEYWRAMNVHSPQWFQGTPSTLGRFASWISGKGYLGPKSIRLIELIGEVVTAADRDAIANAFPDAAIANAYAASEVWTIAYECPRGSLHTLTDNVYVEILDGASASGRITGEIAVTSLVFGAMPLVRYRLGDLISVRAVPCSCGRPGPVIDNILGRTAEFALCPSGEEVHPHFFTTIIERVNSLYPHAIRRFQFVQHDSWMEVRIEEGEGWTLDAKSCLGRLFAGKFSDMEMRYKFDAIKDPVGGKYRTFKRL